MYVSPGYGPLSHFSRVFLVCSPSCGCAAVLHSASSLGAYGYRSLLCSHILNRPKAWLCNCRLGKTTLVLHLRSCRRLKFVSFNCFKSSQKLSRYLRFLLLYSVHFISYQVFLNISHNSFYSSIIFCLTSDVHHHRPSQSDSQNCCRIYLNKGHLTPLPVF